MDWYLKAAFNDRRFRMAGLAAAVLGVALAATFLIGASWATQVALFGIFPALVLTVGAMFVVMGLVVRQDYLERKGAPAVATSRTSKDRSPSP